MVESVGAWDLEPEFEIESLERFQEEIAKIKDKFDSIIKRIEIVDILGKTVYESQINNETEFTWNVADSSGTFGEGLDSSARKSVIHDNRVL